jgi:hypothetical protein
VADDEENDPEFRLKEEEDVEHEHRNDRAVHISSELLRFLSDFQSFVVGV